MPELPEAEANRRRIESVLNRTIERVWLGEVEHMDMPPQSERERLVGRQFTETDRHGKLIFAGSRSGPWICIHLGMTGSIKTYDEERGEPDYAKFVVDFEGDRRLAFTCPRKLGWVHITDDPERYVSQIGFGPDALEITREAFVEVIGGTRGAVKSALMQQKKLAGIGNLWSDEICFQTGTNPDAKGTDLSEERVSDMYDAMRDILAAVSDTDMDYGKLPEHWVIHCRDEGADCPRCDGTIRKATVGGRSAYYCDSHQA